MQRSCLEKFFFCKEMGRPLRDKPLLALKRCQRLKELRLVKG